MYVPCVFACLCVCVRLCACVRVEEAEEGLKSSLLGISDGSPHVEHKLVREGKVPEGLVQRHRKHVRVGFVPAKLNHGGGWRETSSSREERDRTDFSALMTALTNSPKSVSLMPM